MFSEDERMLEQHECLVANYGIPDKSNVFLVVGDFNRKERRARGRGQRREKEREEENPLASAGVCTCDLLVHKICTLAVSILVHSLYRVE